MFGLSGTHVPSERPSHISMCVNARHAAEFVMREKNEWKWSGN